MSEHAFLTRNLARAFLSGEWSLEALVRRGAEACGGKGRWLRPLTRRLFAALPAPKYDEGRLVEFLEKDRGWKRVLRSSVLAGRSWRIFRVPPRTNSPGFPLLEVLPSLGTPEDVARWLGIAPRDLDWLAPPSWRLRKGRQASSHYRHHWVKKSSRGWRLLEAPKPRLKAVQRRILHGLLARVLPHECAHGFRKGRSIVTYATPHVGREVVMRFDLKDFFPSVPAARVHALFRRLGYPEEAARVLTGLCTHITPSALWDGAPPGAEAEARRLFERRHLPQGAPTSPALANLCARRFDTRLAGLARHLGAAYTRYADDLAFSGGTELARCARRLHVLVCIIALEEGFEIQTSKTRVLRQGIRQQLAGVVVNAVPNVRRRDFDRLKAVLHNCVRHGPESQNRDGLPDFRAHLLGRIAHVTHVHPARGAKLRTLFDRIAWGT